MSFQIGNMVLNAAMWTGRQFFLQNRSQSWNMSYHYGSFVDLKECYLYEHAGTLRCQDLLEL